MAASTGSNLQSIDLWGTGRMSRGRSMGSKRSLGGSSRHWGLGVDNVFAKDSESRRSMPEEDDEEALKWAALEKLPTFDRLRTTVLEKMGSQKPFPAHVDVTTAGIDENRALLRSVFNMNSTEGDNEAFLNRLRERINRVGIQQPTTEVRYENLTIQADCYVGNRALPSLTNAARNSIESMLDSIGVPVTKKATISILHEVSGIIRPGRTTLLLGPPGSGKTSLLLALSGRLDKSLKVDGKLTYNGHTLDEFVPQKTAAYVSQHDLHIGEMTVRETLDFSAQCQGVGERYDLMTELIRREKEAGLHPESDVDYFMKATAASTNNLITEYIMKITGLDICSDTMVGDDMRRGISGGQKKRVTTAEMIVGPLRTLFMDEISTGLDSSTTFQIVKCLRDVAHIIECTVMISLLQPAPETFDLFDDVVLLSEGMVVYHGPREHILEFFQSCGYRCPERKGVADFLQEVTSRKDQEQYWANKGRPYEYTSVKEFCDAFKSFHVGLALSRELSHPYDKTKSHPAALAFKRYSVPYIQLLKTSFDREVLLMKRSAFVSFFKAFQICIMAFIAMTVYLRTEMSRNNIEDAQTYGGALFFGVVNVLFNGFSELSMTIIRLPVFYKQRDLLFHPPWTYSLSKFILTIPTSVLESGLWCIITYYTIGFAPEAGRFFRQLFLYFSVHQMASGLFRFIAGVCRSMVVANTGGSISLLVLFVLGGFLLPRTSIEPWWIWGYWVSPLSYAQNGADVNEFLAPEWDKPVDGSNLSLGRQFLKSAGLFGRGYWYWIAVAVNLGYAVLFNVLFTLAITYLNPVGQSQATISEEAYAEKQAAVTGEDSPAVLESKKISRPISSSGHGVSTSRRQPRSLAGSSRENAEIGMSRLNSASRGSNNNSSLGRETYQVGGETSSAGIANKGMILPFEPLAISFDNVKYFVDMPAEMKAQGAVENRLQLLRGVTGAFRPGVLTALVGVSGAGKSTLMDVLAGRKTGGYIEGDVRISGYPKKQETFARISGYCEQNDIHSPQVTVFESLVYSAWLRLDRNIDKSKKELFVQQVMDLVELTPVKDALVGLPGLSGLSTEQRKRLTIAVELVANPSIIFMDEPTSGLDARAAAIVMRCVRNTVDTGRTVVCTIHQPSIDIFEAFDELLLMKRGGQVIYAGPLGRHSHKLVEYFEAIPGIPKIKEGYNPATWMLEVSSVAVEQRLEVDFADLYANSSLAQMNKSVVRELSTPPAGSKDLYFPSQFSQPFWTQTAACLWKQNITYWRSPEYNNVRFLFTVLAALLFGTIFWRLGMKRDTQSNVFSIMGSMLGAVLFIGINNASTVQPVVATERTVFYRERAAGMYSAYPYAIAQVLIEVPYCFAQVVIYSVVTYTLINYEWTVAKFFWYMYFMFFTFLYFTFYGMMAVGLTPNHNIAAIVSAFFYSIFNLFSGFVISKQRIPGWWIWYYWICPVAWTIYGLVVTQFGTVETTLRLTGTGEEVRVKDFVKASFGYEYDFLPVVAIMLLVFPLLFAGVFMVSIKYLNFQNR